MKVLHVAGLIGAGVLVGRFAKKTVPSKDGRRKAWWFDWLDPQPGPGAGNYDC